MLALKYFSVFSYQCGTGNAICTNGAWSDCSAPQPSPEICDGVDNNCDGVIDEGCSYITSYRDADGYGNPSDTISGSTPSSGYVTNNTEGDDTDAAIYPGAFEIPCNGIDDDCNGDLNGDQEITPLNALIAFECYLGIEICPSLAII